MLFCFLNIHERLEKTVTQRTLTPQTCVKKQKAPHNAAGVGLSYGVGVSEGEAGALRGRGLTKRLEEAAGLLRRLLTEQTACGGTKTAGRCCREENTDFTDCSSHLWEGNDLNFRGRQ